MLLLIITRKIRSFARLSRFEKAWLLPAWFLLGLSRLLILLVPFRLLVLGFGTPYGSNAWVPLLGAREEAMALAISRIVLSAARNTPWKSNCFPQALAARMLLGFYGVPYVLFFGVTRDIAETKMKAHAWVAAGRIRVTGGESFSRFAVVGCFVSSRFSSLE
ncbi:lasso peptide biosynthesis B2 protein [Methylomonas fluvii]|uniref:Lasso peptide biosynthesis B2 protein n=1 Tax=Methylomonas fluvii TaxID=1854564 RepID=A0ABR9DH59_9GAMM|nr:lasso peptide biosynthesis B2 protein [Methylomonas fluvii]MBD9362431.1 lasso peptide biosynthesis B2 protein [Methylomonas fluvii]